MRKVLKVLLSVLVYGLLILLSILTGSLPFDEGLNTKKIDRHIEKLKELAWFKNVYEDERHHQSFFINRKVRKYLQSSVRVRLLIKSEKSQKRFMKLLEEQAVLREKNKA